MEHRITNSDRYYTLFIVLLPIFSMYRGVSEDIDFGITALLILFIIKCFITKKIYFRLYKEWRPYIYYVLITTIPVYLTSLQYKSLIYVIGRLLQDVACLLIVFISFDNKFVDGNFFIESYQVVGLFVSWLGILQFILYYLTGHKLVLAILPLLQNQGYVQPLSGGLVYGGFYRATSVFYEPSYFYCYCFALLIIALFSENTKYRVFRIVTYTLGALVTFSGQALIGLILCYLIFAIMGVINKGKLNLTNFFVLLLIIIIVIVALNRYQSIFQFSINRMLNRNNIGGNAIDVRLQGYNHWLDYGFLNKLIGTGYGNVVEDFYASYSFVICSTGLIGLVFYIYMFKGLLGYTSTKVSKICWLFLLYLSITSTMLNGTNLVFNTLLFYSVCQHEFITNDEVTQS